MTHSYCHGPNLQHSDAFEYQASRSCLCKCLSVVAVLTFEEVYFIISNGNVHICSILYKHDSVNLNDLRMRNFLSIMSVHLKVLWGFLNIISDKMENNLGKMLLNLMKLVVVQILIHVISEKCLCDS